MIGLSKEEVLEKLEDLYLTTRHYASLSGRPKDFPRSVFPFQFVLLRNRIIRKYGNLQCDRGVARNVRSIRFVQKYLATVFKKKFVNLLFDPFLIYRYEGRGGFISHSRLDPYHNPPQSFLESVFLIVF